MLNLRLLLGITLRLLRHYFQQRWRLLKLYPHLCVKILATYAPYFHSEYSFAGIFSRDVLCMHAMKTCERQICWISDKWQLEIKFLIKLANPLSVNLITKFNLRTLFTLPLFFEIKRCWLHWTFVWHWRPYIASTVRPTRCSNITTAYIVSIYSNDESL